jgi:hypothetical protein
MVRRTLREIFCDDLLFLVLSLSRTIATIRFMLFSNWIIKGTFIPSTINMPHAAFLLNRQESCGVHIQPLLIILTFLLSRVNF